MCRAKAAEVQTCCPALLCCAVCCDVCCAVLCWPAGRWLPWVGIGLTLVAVKHLVNTAGVQRGCCCLQETRARGRVQHPHALS